MKIIGPFCTSSCMCSDVEFLIKGRDGRLLGKISKQWSGFVQESITDADNFGVTFPLDLDVKMKAVLISACFLIVCLYLLLKYINGFFFRITCILRLQIIDAEISKVENI